ncbi:lycopene cyclase domain-containing protein [Halovivax asiaticus JCM 14624]|uniref:Lycopene cyclase domain-containing protein n=1 Tax=Halovivax asiaticus JCM 14624 TaxID=1227490 RepID=M0BC65_9EURY|nr:lycopene cyclase domain-containing protein [Halovivax asiaticus]ELZ08425.1 lycopene cyclase domain-containing protein [Halovivax asiaticus JCM 14624]
MVSPVTGVTRFVRAAVGDESERVRPDIGVFGRFTYLVTELFWGTIAFVALRRTGSLRRAARTIVALYPIAYVWDRYTLSVGVFSIELRTGVDVAGIPVEEHLFMVVVPGLVLAIDGLVHERRSESG